MGKTEESVNVSLRLKRKSIDRIEKVSELLHTTNRTQAISTSLALAEAILKRFKDEPIVLLNPDGTKETITLV
ncbi:hypothetical protein AUTU_00410 [Aureibacter tunicatorum]|nr:hypothetical protein AUTU_00410 [Aureibacter tunicatorum]